VERQGKLRALLEEGWIKRGPHTGLAPCDVGGGGRMRPLPAAGPGEIQEKPHPSDPANPSPEEERRKILAYERKLAGGACIVLVLVVVVIVVLVHAANDML
jgi:hypothetical protein